MAQMSESATFWAIFEHCATTNNNSHFHTFHLNTPRISSLVETRLHDMGNCLALTKDLCQIFSTEHISESRSC